MNLIKKYITGGMILSCLMSLSLLYGIREGHHGHTLVTGKIVNGRLVGGSVDVSPQTSQGYVNRILYGREGMKRQPLQSRKIAGGHTYYQSLRQGVGRHSGKIKLVAAAAIALGIVKGIMYYYQINDMEAVKGLINQAKDSGVWPLVQHYWNAAKASRLAGFIPSRESLGGYIPTARQAGIGAAAAAGTGPGFYGLTRAYSRLRGMPAQKKEEMMKPAKMPQTPGAQPISPVEQANIAKFEQQMKTAPAATTPPAMMSK